MKFHISYRGFTLIEAVLSITLLSIGIVGLLFGFYTATKSSARAEQTLTALNLGQETLEKIIAKRDCAVSGCGYASTLSAIQAGAFNSSSIAGFAAYSIQVSALEVNASDTSSTDDFLVPQPGSGYARVTADVFFNNTQNKVRLVTLISNY